MSPVAITSRSLTAHRSGTVLRSQRVPLRVEHAGVDQARRKPDSRAWSPRSEYQQSRSQHNFQLDPKRGKSGAVQE